KILTILFEEGLDVLHLRKPDAPCIYSERLLTLIPDKYHKYIVIHDHFYLKDDFLLMGIHLNERNPYKPYHYLGHVSCSCYSIEELKNKRGSYNYVCLDSVYDTHSQEISSLAYTPEELRIASREKIINNKVMAMGGINVDNIPEVIDFGFGGAVITDDLWSKFDIHRDKDYNILIEHFKQLKKIAG
ncbi:Thiamine-phosphate synthase, partial [termite gut metagenome]